MFNLKLKYFKESYHMHYASSKHSKKSLCCCLDVLILMMLIIFSTKLRRRKNAASNDTNHMCNIKDAHTRWKMSVYDDNDDDNLYTHDIYCSNNRRNGKILITFFF